MKPIIFSTQMVKAILEGRKTQTRRIVKPILKDCSEVHKVFKEAEWKNSPAQFVSSFDGSNSWYCRYCGNGTNGMGEGFKSPYGLVGDIIYVRETYVKACLSEDGEGPGNGESWKYWYKADDEWTKHDWHNPDVDGPVASPRWKPSIHMPKEAARLFLKITDIRVERLQDVSMDDAVDEGIEYAPEGKNGEYHGYKNYYPEGDDAKTIGFGSSIRSFRSLWSKINGPESWDANPWCWCITFERIEKPL